jgi:CBS-domain-containing membrane protein
VIPLQSYYLAGPVVERIVTVPPLAAGIALELIAICLVAIRGRRTLKPFAGAISLLLLIKIAVGSNASIAYAIGPAFSLTMVGLVLAAIGCLVTPCRNERRATDHPLDLVAYGGLRLGPVQRSISVR